MRNIIIILFVLLSSCKLTEKSVTGKWVSNWDSLMINSNHSFFLNNSNKIGTWSVSKRHLVLKFAEDNNVFNNCGGLQKRGWLLSRNKLMRPTPCSTPTHHFIKFSKVK